MRKIVNFRYKWVILGRVISVLYQPKLHVECSSRNSFGDTSNVFLRLLDMKTHGTCTVDNEGEVNFVSVMTSSPMIIDHLREYPESKFFLRDLSNVVKQGSTSQHSKNWISHHALRNTSLRDKLLAWRPHHVICEFSVSCFSFNGLSSHLFFSFSLL